MCNWLGCVQSAGAWIEYFHPRRVGCFGLFVLVLLVCFCFALDERIFIMSTCRWGETHTEREKTAYFAPLQLSAYNSYLCSAHYNACAFAISMRLSYSNGSAQRLYNYQQFLNPFFKFISPPSRAPYVWWCGWEIQNKKQTHSTFTFRYKMIIVGSYVTCNTERCVYRGMATIELCISSTVRSLMLRRRIKHRLKIASCCLFCVSLSKILFLFFLI